MTSPLRLAYPGAPYHVIARGNARQTSSTEDQAQQRFLAVRTEGVTRARWLRPAYCLKDPPSPLLLETAQGNFLTTIGQ